MVSASERVDSARSISPWILSARAASVAFRAGKANFHSAKKTMRKASPATISSTSGGISTLMPPASSSPTASAARINVFSIGAFLSASVLVPGRDSDDERQHEAEQRQRLDERDTEEHRRAHHAGRLGLPSHRLDRLAHQEADADAGADGGEAVDEALADGADVAGEAPFGRLRENVEHVLPPSQVRSL